MSASSSLIDFHAHILPGVDHGSSGIEESLNQLALMHRSGVDIVVATPHFYPNEHKIDDHLCKVAAATEELANRPVKTPRICLGAEILYCDGLEYMERLDELCILGTNVLMLELPTGPWGTHLFDTLYSLLRSYTVVLAHVDRYLPMHTQDIEQLLNMGAVAQVNTDSLSGFLSRRRTMPFFLDDRTVALGSDLHQENKKTYRKFLKARKRYIVAFDHIMPRTAKLLETAKTI